MIGITLLGSTGSIGVSTLDVVERHREWFRIVALTANQDAEGMAVQCRRHRPEYAVMADPVAASRLRLLLVGMAQPPEVLAGTAALESVAALPPGRFRDGGDRRRRRSPAYPGGRPRGQASAVGQ